MKIVFTGGGTAGHISLNLALIPYFIERGYKVHYIGSKDGMEKDLVSDIDKVYYHEISTGKLRRYFSLENFKDPFRVFKGIIQSKRLIKQIKPNIVFSKGGFVSFPVVVGAKMNGVPVVIHESDLSAGLANRLSFPFCKKIFLTFDNDKFKKKGEYIGAIVRDGLDLGDKDKGKKLCGFLDDKPTLLVMGGSLGAKSINEAIWNNLDELLKKFNIIHICGKGSLRDIKKEGYVQFEFVKDELKDIFAISNMVISRAGANSIFEFLSIKLPMLLVPLPLSQSRGDQIENANYFKDRGYCEVLYDEDIFKCFLDKVFDTFEHVSDIKKNMENQKELGSIEDVVNKIIELEKK